MEYLTRYLVLFLSQMQAVLGKVLRLARHNEHTFTNMYGSLTFTETDYREYDGCNGGSGKYSVNGNTVTLHGSFITEKFCRSDDPDFGRAKKAMRQLLGKYQYHFEDNVLILISRKDRFAFCY